MQTLPLDQSVAMIRQHKRDLTVIANDTAMPGKGIGKLVEAGLLRKAIVSHIGLNPETQRLMMAGELEVELVPQGTLIERIRAGGYGLGGILTQTGIGTAVENGKQRIEVDGKDYLLELALRADFALVQAFIADYLGNLSYALTARNFNPGLRWPPRRLSPAPSISFRSALSRPITS
jgi:acetate CoA/acetoacetate CoA-transferase alpha subunit